MNSINDTQEIAVPVVIPAYQPGRRLVSYVRNLVDEGLNPIYIVNDGSEEAYDAIFSELEKISNCKLIYHHANMGKGRALKSAFDKILKSEANAVGCITVDSDGQHSVADVKKCIKEFLLNQHCLIMGVRNFSDKSIPPRNRYGNLILRWMYRWFANINLQDTQTGLRVYPLEYMKLCIGVSGDRFDFENRALLASKYNQIPIIQVPIETIYFNNDEYVSHYSPIKDSLIAYGIVLGSFFRCILSSLLSSIIDLFCFWFFCKLLISSAPSTYIFISTAVARIISSLFNYCSNYTFVFHSKKKVSVSIVRYYCLVIIQMLVSASLVTAVRYLSSINVLAIKVCVDSIIYIANYFIQNKKIF